MMNNTRAAVKSGMRSAVDDDVLENSWPECSKKTSDVMNVFFERLRVDDYIVNVDKRNVSTKTNKYGIG